MKKKINSLKRNAIYCNLLDGVQPLFKGSSKIGGRPYLPKEIEWFYANKGENIYPLAFLAQINLQELVQYDKDNVLPTNGILYFFYDFYEETIGCFPQDKEHFKVYFYEGDMANLEEKIFPSKLQEDFCIPEFALKFSNQYEVPMCEEFNEITNMKMGYDEYNYAVEEIGLAHDPEQEIFKLLGYADLCQGSMLVKCEMVSDGISCGNFEHISLRDNYVDKASDWVLLFQLDTISNSEFELMFGNAGRLYFYIKKEDLKKRNFENCWFMTQCY